MDQDKYKSENEQYKEFLEFKEENPDIQMKPATVIGRDSQDYFYSFQIDVGRRHGISERDCVMTADGLVGVITDVSENYSKVTTIFDPSLNIGVFNSVTRETAVISGDAQLSVDGKVKLSYLPRDTEAKAGDYVITTGAGGQFPKDIIIGRIEELYLGESGISMSAVIKPTADIKNTKSVMVITNFLGKGDSE
ncbi:Cell shape-determining protein MreC [bioreactor metagenome]|uniref:Cell shape-determining protein MreC n=1 Tax=bioreactor metagenome TaxID=1076179 RepID=A0A645FUU0_9ZZZZ